MGLDKEYLLSWVRSYLLDLPIIEARIFGSVVDPNVQNPNDIDLFIKYDVTHIREIAEQKSQLIQSFNLEFSLNLHLLILSENEVIEFQDFISNAMENSWVV